MTEITEPARGCKKPVAKAVKIDTCNKKCRLRSDVKRPRIFLTKARVNLDSAVRCAYHYPFAICGICQRDARHQEKMNTYVVKKKRILRSRITLRKYHIRLHKVRKIRERMVHDSPANSSERNRPHSTQMPEEPSTGLGKMTRGIDQIVCNPVQFSEGFCQAQGVVLWQSCEE